MQVRYLAVSGIGSLLTVVLTLLFSFPTLHAQQTTEPGDIQGTVVDRKREKPLASQPVILTIHKADTFETQETTTDENGNYRFGNLPLDPSVHYTVSTVYEGTDYTEKDLVLSTWAPNIEINFEIGAFTEDKAHVRVKTYNLFIGPPPQDHAPDGAVTVIEVFEIENLNDLPFRTTHGTQKVGMHLALPKGIEGFQPHSSVALTMDAATNHITCLLYTSPSPRDRTRSRMPSSA